MLSTKITLAKIFGIGLVVQKEFTDLICLLDLNIMVVFANQYKTSEGSIPDPTNFQQKNLNWKLIAECQL